MPGRPKKSETDSPKELAKRNPQVQTKTRENIGFDWAVEGKGKGGDEEAGICSFQTDYTVRTCNLGPTGDSTSVRRWSNSGDEIVAAFTSGNSKT